MVLLGGFKLKPGRGKNRPWVLRFETVRDYSQEGETKGEVIRAHNSVKGANTSCLDYHNQVGSDSAKQKSWGD